jgi:hypothetical protein
MSDPDFPSQAGIYYKGMQIKFYETLYQHYSNLNFSYTANRAIAMDGLERKIFKTFQTIGAYGIMEKYLHRSLLWQSNEPNAMEEIIFKATDPKPPSWSWMAVKGKIKYLPIEFDSAKWEEEHFKSPFRGSDKHEFGVASSIVAIEAVARDINLTKVGLGVSKIFLDGPKPLASIKGLKCVTLGQQKPRGSLTDGSLVRYVLLIASKQPDNDRCIEYERVGVGQLEGLDILMNGSGVQVQIV